MLFKMKLQLLGSHEGRDFGTILRGGDSGVGIRMGNVQMAEHAQVDADCGSLGEGKR
jgi:hypothetical protein